MLTKQMTNAKIFVLALLCVPFLMGPASAAAPSTPRYGGTLNVGFPSDTKTLDPVFSIQFTERQVLYLIYNTLVKLGPDFSINPELAKSWEVLDGGKKVVFHLREGIKFHDGTAFDASVVKWNIDRRLDKDVGSPQRKQLEPVIKSVEVVDKSTVAFNLTKPFPALFGMLGQRAGFMESPAAVQKWGEDYGSHPVGTGAFEFVEWVRGSHITVKRNPDYWEKGLPYLDKVVFRDIADAIVGAQRVTTGELDVIGQLSPHDIKQLEGKSNIRLYPIKVGRWYSLQWHWDEPPFNNAALRQAIAHAIDRKRVVDIVTLGKGTIAEGPTPPGLWWYDPSVKSYEYDPQKAKEKLAEAGYESGFEVSLSAPSVSIYQQIVQLVQEQLGAIGIEAKLEPVARSEWYSRVVARAINFTPTRWTQRPDPDGLLYILFHSQGFANSTNYHNPKVDALLDQARGTNDLKERKALYAEMQRIAVKDLPWVPLFYSVEYAALRDNVQGFEWIPDQIPRYRALWKSQP